MQVERQAFVLTLNTLDLNAANMMRLAGKCAQHQIISTIGFRVATIPAYFMKKINIHHFHYVLYNIQILISGQAICI